MVGAPAVRRMARRSTDRCARLKWPQTKMRGKCRKQQPSPVNACKKFLIDHGLAFCPGRDRWTVRDPTWFQLACSCESRPSNCQWSDTAGQSSCRRGFSKRSKRRPQRCRKWPSVCRRRPQMFVVWRVLPNMVSSDGLRQGSFHSSCGHIEALCDFDARSKCVIR